LTRELLDVTGWSNRLLAQALAVTHPTVRALKEGRSRTNDNEILERLQEVEDVVSRVATLVGGDRGELRRALSSSPSEGRLSAIELLALRRTADAYLSATQVLRPVRRSPLMASVWPAKAGTATHDLADSDVV
jgi:hypothetical protein